MNPLIQFKTPTPLVLVALLLGCFGLLPATHAVSPPPDGDYPGQNTAEGQAALNSLVQGEDNTAIGYQALFKNEGGDSNTAIGAGALRKT